MIIWDARSTGDPVQGAVGNSQPHHLDTYDDGNLVCQAQDCLLSLLLTMIKTAKIGEARIWTAFSRYSWTVKIWYPSSSERTQSRLFSAVAREGRPHLDGPAVAREGSPDQPQQEREKVDHSYGDPMAVISSSKCNSPDRTWLWIGVEAENCSELRIEAENWTGGKDGPEGWDCPMKVSVHFINICPLKKPNFLPHWRASLSSWSCFEHSSSKMGSPDNEALHWTLCLSIIATCSTSKFHLKMSECSAWGVVMPVANLYGKDCRSSKNGGLLHGRWVLLF